MKLIKNNIEPAAFRMVSSKNYPASVLPENSLIATIGNNQYNNTKELFNITITLTEKGQNIMNALEQLICYEFKITRDELKSDGRYMPLPKARGAFTSILRSNFNFPLKLIGTHLGGRDHSSILMAERRADEFYKKNNGYRFNYDNVQRDFTKFLQENGYNNTVTNASQSSVTK